MSLQASQQDHPVSVQLRQSSVAAALRTCFASSSTTVPSVCKLSVLNVASSCHFLTRVAVAGVDRTCSYPLSTAAVSTACTCEQRKGTMSL